MNFSNYCKLYYLLNSTKVISPVGSFKYCGAAATAGGTFANVVADGYATVALDGAACLEY